MSPRLPTLVACDERSCPPLHKLYTSTPTPPTIFHVVYAIRIHQHRRIYLDTINPGICLHLLKRVYCALSFVYTMPLTKAF